jgi:hypothetical protein
MKTCVTCNNEKHEDVFVKRDGKVLGQCKECRNAYVRQYKHERADGTRTKQEIVVTNGGKICVKCQTWKELNSFPIRKNSTHGYRHECKDCKRTELHNYYVETYNAVRREKKKTDIQFRIICNHRNYVYKCLTRFGLKHQSSINYIGCSVEFLKSWIEYQFLDEMTWDNYGTVWTLDHVIPLSRFNMNSTKEQLIAFNWTNMQPSYDNFVKSDTLRLWEYFNVFISVHRFIVNKPLKFNGYQSMNESLCWLRKHLRYGKNPVDAV